MNELATYMYDIIQILTFVEVNTWLYATPKKDVLTELACLCREWHITTYSPTPKVNICFIIYFQLNH